MEDIVRYTERVTRLKLIEPQKEILRSLATFDDKNRNIVLCCGRGFSKSLLSAAYTMWLVDQYSDSIGRPLEVLLVSGQIRMWRHLNQFMRDNKDLKDKLAQGGVWDEIPKDSFSLKNGSTVIPVIGTQKASRGLRSDVTVIDEACLVKDEIYRKDILPCSTGNLAKIVLLSTPSETQGFFVDIISNPSKYGFTLKQYSAELCPWQLESNKRLKSTLTLAEYKTEVLAEVPTKEERSFFNLKAVRKCFRDDVTEEAENTYGSTFLVGIDLGYSLPNYSVVSIIEKKKSKMKLVEQFIMKTLDVQKIDEEITKVTNNPRVIKVDSKPSELFKLLKENSKYKNRIIAIDSTVHKKSIMSQLQALINSGNLVIPISFVELKMEFERYHAHKRSGDNRIDSLGFAIFDTPIPQGNKTASHFHITQMK